MVCASFPAATLVSGTRTSAGIPAAAAYAASEAEVFPVEAHATTRAPTALAWLTPTVIPRSLNDAVGLCPSCFSSRWPSGRPAQAGHLESASAPVKRASHVMQRTTIRSNISASLMPESDALGKVASTALVTRDPL